MSLDEEVSMRFTTRAEHRTLVAELYEKSEFTPICVEVNDNDTVSFVFEKMSRKKLERLVYVVPHHLSAIQGFMM